MCVCGLCLTFYFKGVLNIFKKCDVAVISFYVRRLLKLILMVEYGFAITSIFGVFYVKNCSQEWNYNTLLLEHGNTAIWHVCVSSIANFFLQTILVLGRTFFYLVLLSEGKMCRKAYSLYL